MTTSPTIINIGNSDDKADWLKLLAGGSHQAADLAASDAAITRLATAPPARPDQPAQEVTP